MESELKGLFDREVKKEVRDQRSEVKQQQKMSLKQEKDDNQVPNVSIIDQNRFKYPNLSKPNLTSKLFTLFEVA
jgi:hypothetical protein